MGCQVGRDAQGTCGVIVILQVNSAKMNGEIRLGLGRNNGFSQVILTSRDLRSADTRQLCGYICSRYCCWAKFAFNLLQECPQTRQKHTRTLLRLQTCPSFCMVSAHTHTSTQCCLHFRHAYSTCCLDRLDPSTMQTYTSCKRLHTSKISKFDRVTSHAACCGRLAKLQTVPSSENGHRARVTGHKTLFEM